MAIESDTDKRPGGQVPTMPDPATLRDSTQILVRASTLAGLEERLTDECTVTVVHREDGYCRIIGSPVEIKRAGALLARNGVTIP